MFGKHFWLLTNRRSHQQGLKILKEYMPLMEAFLLGQRGRARRAAVLGTGRSIRKTSAREESRSPRISLLEQLLSLGLHQDRLLLAADVDLWRPVLLRLAG